MATYWMSFCDGSRPKGQQFTGVAIVEAEDMKATTTKAWQTGCNPGGQIALVEVPDDKLSTLDGMPRDTLLSRSELRQWGLI